MVSDLDMSCGNIKWILHCFFGQFYDFVGAEQPVMRGMLISRPS